MDPNLSKVLPTIANILSKHHGRNNVYSKTLKGGVTFTCGVLNQQPHGPCTITIRKKRFDKTINCNFVTGFLHGKCTITSTNVKEIFHTSSMSEAGRALSCVETQTRTENTTCFFAGGSLDGRYEIETKERVRSDYNNTLSRCSGYKIKELIEETTNNCVSNYSNGLLNGPHTTIKHVVKSETRFDKNDISEVHSCESTTCNYSQGVLSGPYEVRSGDICILSCTYHSGKKCGPFIQNNKDGTPYIKCCYDNDMLQGEYMEFFNGKLLKY